MQDETQNPGADAAPEPNNAPDPGAAANPPVGEAEGLNQEAPAPDSAAASTPTDQGAGAFDPSVTMRPEDLADPAAPTDPASSMDLGDPASRNTGVAGPLGTPPPETVEQEEGPPRADELEPDDAASASDWGDWTAPTGFIADPFPTDQEEAPGVSHQEAEGGFGRDASQDFDWSDWSWSREAMEEPSATDQAEPLGSETAAPTAPEAVSMPIDKIVDPVPTDQVQPPDSEVAAPPPLNLADQIDPDWPVLQELNAGELLEVQDVLGDPSRLSDPEVLEDLSSDQMQAVMQALVGHLSASGTGVVEDTGEGSGDGGGEIPDTPDQAGEWVTGIVGDDIWVDASGNVWESPEAAKAAAQQDTGEGGGDDGGEISDTPDQTEAAAQLPDLTEQLDPDSPLLNELSSHELEEVQEVLGDPSRLSDPEVLEDLSSDQMQVVMQALVGHLSTPETGVVEDTGEGGEVVEPGVIPPDALPQELDTGVIPDADAGGEPVDAPDASGAAVGGAAVGAGAAGDLGETAQDIFGDLLGSEGGFPEFFPEALDDLVGETAQDIGEALGIGADDISEIAQDPFGAISDAAEGYLGGLVEENIPLGEILEGNIGEAALGALGSSIGGPVEDILEGDIGEAVLGGLGVSVGGPLGGAIGGALGEVAEDVIEEIPVVGDLFEATEGITDGLEQAAEEVVDDVVEDIGDFFGF